MNPLTWWLDVWLSVLAPPPPPKAECVILQFRRRAS
jgi:hypothetical protein